MHHIDTKRRGATGRQERLPRGLSMLVISALSALSWAVLIAIVRALLLL